MSAAKTLVCCLNKYTLPNKRLHLLQVVHCLGMESSWGISK